MKRAKVVPDNYDPVVGNYRRRYLSEGEVAFFLQAWVREVLNFRDFLWVADLTYLGVWMGLGS